MIPVTRRPLKLGVLQALKFHKVEKVLFNPIRIFLCSRKRILRARVPINVHVKIVIISPIELDHFQVKSYVRSTFCVVCCSSVCHYYVEQRVFRSILRLNGCKITLNFRQQYVLVSPLACT
jgi:hypothetical protein